MTSIVWPCDRLPPRNISIDPAYRSISGPSAISGFSQVVASDAGLWKATFDTIPVHEGGFDRIKLWRAIAGLAEGRLNPILICAFEQRRRPLPDGVVDGVVDGSVPHSDGAFFSDGSGYLSRTVSIFTSASAAVRATTLVLTKITPVDLEPPQRFSIGERMYQIKSIVEQDDTAATVRIWPPLRDFVGSGAELEFDRPVLRVRLATDQEMDLPLEFGRWSFPSVNFIEDL